MLEEGVNLMGVGMTTVFSFLALLVIVLQISARVFASIGHRWPDPPTAPSRLAPSAQSDVEVVVAVAAIEAHRRRHS